MVLQFLELCKFEIEKECFELLYRGSRDGFEAKHFHSKCNDRPNTITIIETTNGYIFGGFTKSYWSSSFGYFSDPNAFLFSLVSHFSNKTFVCKVRDPSTAIVNSSKLGPSFGKSDIHIDYVHSNFSYGGTTQLQSYQLPAGITQSNGYYFCDSSSFQIEEIEVFQVHLLNE